MACPKCSSDNIVKYGKVIRKGGKVQRYACNDCGHAFIIKVVENDYN